jgi:hypothetical protein
MNPPNYNYKYDKELSELHQHAVFRITEGVYQNVCFKFGVIKFDEDVPDGVDEAKCNFEFHVLKDEHTHYESDLDFQMITADILKQTLIAIYEGTSSDDSE